MNIIARIAERIPEIIPHSMIENAKDILISPNPAAQTLIAPNPGVQSLIAPNTAALTTLANPIHQAIAYTAFLALMALTAWQIHKAVKITRLK